MDALKQGGFPVNPGSTLCEDMDAVIAYCRRMETDRDALKAMSQVLERVEAWRAGRLQ